MHAAGHRGRTGSLTSLPVLPLSLVDEEHWRRGWSTGHHRSLMDLGGTVDFRRAVDEFCSPISFPFARTTDYYILRHPRCLRRLLGFWFTIRTSAWYSSRSTFDPPPAYIIIHIHCIPTPYTLFSSVFSVFSLSFSSTISQPIPRQFAYFSFEVSLPSSHSYTHISFGSLVYPLLFRLFNLLFFSRTHHSLYLANLHIFSSRVSLSLLHSYAHSSSGSLDFFGLYL